MNDAASGYLSLARHPHQADLQEILGCVDADELWAAAATFRFRKLTRQLPDSHRRHALKEYAKRLDDAAGERTR